MCRQFLWTSVLLTSSLQGYLSETVFQALVFSKEDAYYSISTINLSVEFIFVWSKIPPHRKTMGNRLFERMLRRTKIFPRHGNFDHSFGNTKEVSSL